MIKLHPKQQEVIKSKKRNKLLNWGRRSGKTFVVGYEIFIDLWNIDDAKVSYYAPTRDDARDIAWVDFTDLLRDITVKTNETLLEIVVKNRHGGTSLLKLAGWEAVKNRDKGRGGENNLVVLDECAFFPLFMEKFDKVIGPTLLTTKGRTIITSTPNGFNHFYELANVAQNSDDWFFSHATSYDNPHNEEGEIEAIKARITEDRFAQEYLADFRKQEGLVYKEFDRAKHVVDHVPEHYDELIAGIDFGFTNPTAVLHIVRDGDENYTVINEWYKTGRTDEQIKDYVKSCSFNRIYPDPASPSAIEVMNQAGLPIVEVNKNKDSIKTGISRVRQLFKMGKLHIHRDCVNLIEELEAYSYPPKKDSHNEEENPIKENDHALDALRYALMTNNTDNIVPREKMIANYWEQKRNRNLNAR
jgi:PBSX family phage terminase large subunit